MTSLERYVLSASIGSLISFERSTKYPLFNALSMASCFGVILSPLTGVLCCSKYFSYCWIGFPGAEEIIFLHKAANLFLVHP
jgi:hypothetical protein